MGILLVAGYNRITEKEEAKRESGQKTAEIIEAYKQGHKTC
jgi:hypothetical protein